MQNDPLDNYGQDPGFPEQTTQQERLSQPERMTGNHPDEINPNAPQTGNNPNEINPNIPETGNQPNEPPNGIIIQRFAAFAGTGSDRVAVHFATLGPRTNRVESVSIIGFRIIDTGTAAVT